MDNKDLRDAVRASVRERRNTLSRETINEHSANICQRIEPLLSDSHRIGGYLALGAEVNLSTFSQSYFFSERQYYVPIVEENYEMKFAPIDKATPMVRNRYGIDEPLADPSSLKSGMDLDAILVPLVAFDRFCNRMGMGAGYYDRCFAERMMRPSPPLLIGVAFECQQVATVFPNTWDVPLDVITTENRILKRSTDKL